MSIFFDFNGKLYSEKESVISVDNRSLRYGDGLFETMKAYNGVVLLKEYHFDRLFLGLKSLEFELPDYFTAPFLENKITAVCQKNGHTSAVRIRMMVFRGGGGLDDFRDKNPNYIIETWKLDVPIELNDNGLILDIFPDAKKSCDKFANIKNNNFLPYVMAAIYAKKLQVDDCIVLNNHERICDTTVANIYVIKDDLIYTPPLTEGCIAGVMRRYLIERIPPGFTIIEKQLSIEELEDADEVFLTNAIKNIRWVSRFRKKEYGNLQIKRIFNELRSKLI